MSVNTTRGGMAANVTEAIDGARLIGFNDSGEACVWYGGYGFNVYDVARDWSEIRHFNSGELVGMTDDERQSDEGTEYAVARMYSEGFTPVTNYYGEDL